MRKKFVLKETPFEMAFYHKDENSLHSSKEDYRKGKTSKRLESKNFGEFKEIGSTPTHKIYRKIIKHNRGTHSASFLAMHKETGEPHVSVSGKYDTKKKKLTVNHLAGHPNNTLKAHDFYHHLLLAGHVKKLVSDNTQSPGAKKVWHRLSQKPHVGMTTTDGRKVNPKDSIEKFDQKHYTSDAKEREIDKNITDRNEKSKIRKKEYTKARRRFVAKSTLEEEAPTNSVAGGGVPSLTDGSVVPPKARASWKAANAKGQGILRRKIESLPLREGTFAGMKTFIVPSHVVENCKYHKIKHKHWTKYLGEDAIGVAIREFANSHPDEAIILEDERTGTMVFCRYGKK